MKLLLERWRQFIDEARAQGDFQRDAMIQRRKANRKLLDLGANLHKEKGHTRRKSGSTVSAPPGALEESMENNTVIVVFGPTGSGKSTYKKHFTDKEWREIKTHTTRARRDTDDDEYVFYEGDRGKRLWLAKDQKNDFINTNEYEGNYYGTDKKEFLKSGKAIMLSDVTNVETLREFGESHKKNMIFLHASGLPSWAPTPEAMKASMKERGTPERFKVWQKEVSMDSDVPYAHLVSNTEEADAIVSMEMTTK